MTRSRNTNKSGSDFSTAQIDAVWAKATPIAGKDASKHRKDGCGTTIDRDQYGKQTDTGWETDHINPVSKGGDEEPGNLQPLHWKTNRDKAPWKCP